MKFKLILGLFVFLILISYVDAQSSGVCCLESDGFCMSSVEAESCAAGGGEGLGPGNCYTTNGNTQYIDQCLLGGCVFQASSRCSIISISQCAQLGGEFDATVSSVDECITKHITSNPAPVVEEETIESCSPDRTEIWNVKANGEYVSVKEECVVDEQHCSTASGNPECVRTSCNIGDDVIVREIDLGTGQPYVIGKEVNREVLGLTEEDVRNGRNKRLHGESWCVIFGTDDGNDWELFPKRDIIKTVEILPNTVARFNANEVKNDFKKYSAGQRHYKYSCVNGEVDIEEGDLFRGLNGVCFENWEAEYYLLGTEYEKWGMCSTKKAKDAQKLKDGLTSVRREVYDVVDALSLGTRSRRAIPSRLDDERQIDYQLSKRGFSQAVLVDNYATTGESCRQKYILGSVFYSEPVDTRGGYELNCGNCGKGFFNRCDDNECYRKGDCSFKGGGGLKGLFQGCVAGAVIAETLWLTGGTIGLHSSGGWGSIFAAPATNAAGGIQNTGALATGQSGASLANTGAVPGLTATTSTPTLTGITVPTTSSTLGATATTGITTGATATGAVAKVGSALKTTAQVAQYLLIADQAGQRVNAAFNGPRNIRDNPSLDSDVSRTIGAGENVLITGVNEVDGNIWGDVDGGGVIMLNSPDGSNSASLTTSNG